MTAQEPVFERSSRRCELNGLCGFAIWPAGCKLFSPWEPSQCRERIPQMLRLQPGC